MTLSSQGGSYSTSWASGARLSGLERWQEWKGEEDKGKERYFSGKLPITNAQGTKHHVRREALPTARLPAPGLSPADPTPPTWAA